MNGYKDVLSSCYVNFVEEVMMNCYGKGKKKVIFVLVLFVFVVIRLR